MEPIRYLELSRSRNVHFPGEGEGGNASEWRVHSGPKFRPQIIAPLGQLSPLPFGRWRLARKIGSVRVKLHPNPTLAPITLSSFSYPLTLWFAKSSACKGAAAGAYVAAVALKTQRRQCADHTLYV